MFSNKNEVLKVHVIANNGCHVDAEVCTNFLRNFADFVKEAADISIEDLEIKIISSIISFFIYLALII